MVSVIEASKKLGLTRQAIYQRMRLGWTIDEAMTKESQKALYVYNGESVRNIISDAEYQRFRKLVIRGMSIKEAILECKKPLDKTAKYTYKGKAISKILTPAQYQKIRILIIQGVDTEKAVKTVLKNQKITIKRKKEQKKYKKKQ